MKTKSFFFSLVSAITILCAQNLFAEPSYPNPYTISATPLLWSAQESGADDWAQIFIGDDIEILDVSFDWNTGIRVGFDYMFSHNCWDTQLTYTWFSTTGKDSAHSTGQITSSFLGNFYVANLDGAKDSGATYHDASMRWKIQFNMFDWEVGCLFGVTPRVSFRPFVGLKGGWIHQSIHSKWENPTIRGFTLATENLKNNYCGIGPSVGVNTRWHLSHCFGLFGDFTGALMWGRWSFADVYKNNEPFTVDVSMPTITGGNSMLRAFVGLEYEVNCFSMRLGYEGQFWFNQLRFYSFNLGRLNNLLTLQGATLDLNYRF
jgi:hypothetical protein